MFIFLISLTFVTYPLIFVGSFCLGVIILIISDGSPSAPNPFVSPLKVFEWYKQSFSKLGKWYQDNKD